MRFTTLTGVLGLALFVAACGGAPPPPAAQPQAEAPPEEPALVPERIQLQLLWITWVGAEDAPDSVTRSREQAEPRARIVASLVRDGGDFSELAEEYSDRPTSPVHVSTGADELPPGLEEAALEVGVGNATGLFEGEQGFVIARRLPDPPTGPREVSAQHVLVMHSASRRVPEGITRTREEALARAEDVRRRALEPNVDWNALVTEFTDEEGAPEGGDLGSFGRGMMVPAFERAAFALQVGEISRVVESPFGFHVIRRYQ